MFNRVATVMPFKHAILEIGYMLEAQSCENRGGGSAAYTRATNTNDIGVFFECIRLFAKVF